MALLRLHLAQPEHLGALTSAPAPACIPSMELNYPPSVLATVIRRLVNEACGAHALVAARALQILGAPHVLLNFVGPFNEMRVHVQERLHSNARGHWSAVVRADSDEIFDSLLDFA
jgi:hypothetical protein